MIAKTDDLCIFHPLFCFGRKKKYSNFYSQFRTLFHNIVQYVIDVMKCYVGLDAREEHSEHNI